MVAGVPPFFRPDLVRWKHLVSPAWLAALIEGQAVAAVPAPGWHLLEVGCDGLQPYLAGHIRGARYLDTRQCEQLPFWNALSAIQLRGVLAHLGIGPASSVILYGRNSLAAARLAHLMLYAGVSDVRLLDGGLADWTATGHSLQRGLPKTLNSHAPLLASTWSDQAPAWPGCMTDTPQARTMASGSGGALVSIRSRAEYLGETSGYDYIATCGEIPGALWGHAGLDGDVNNMACFQDGNGRMRSAAEIERMWSEAGIRRDRHVAFYCGTGWRASLAFFYAWLMGWEHISVYDGGWMEWSSNQDNPVVCHTDRMPVSPL